VAKVGTSKVGGTISQQAAVHPWLAADAHRNKQTTRPGSETARLLELWVRFPPGAWIFAFCECFVCLRVEVSATANPSFGGVLPRVWH
jgi:hypothetical protein